MIAKTDTALCNLRSYSYKITEFAKHPVRPHEYVFPHFTDEEPYGQER